MSKETKEEIMRGFAAMSPEMQKGIAIGLAAAMSVDSKKADSEKKEA